jgi:amino acid adenylation domain-containing protein
MTDRALIVLAHSGAVPVADLSAGGAAVIAATFAELGPVEVLEVGNQDAISSALAASVSAGATLAVSQSGFGLALPAALVDPVSLQLLARAIIGISDATSLPRLVDVAGWRDGFQADHSAAAVAARAWWSQHLQGQVRWPFAPASPTSDPVHVSEDRAVPAAIAVALSAMARTRGWHPSTPWIGAWWLLLRAIADKPLTLWTELDGRGFAQLQDCLGKLAQHAPLSIPLEPGDNFADRLETLNRALLAGTERQDYAPTGDDRQITFAWHVPLLEQCQGGVWEERRLVVPPHDHDLCLRVSAGLNQTMLHLHGSGRLIAKDDLSLLADMLVAVLDAMATDPDRDWRTLLPETTRSPEFRQTAPRTIINDIARWARDCPDDFAVLDAFDSITYQQLWDRAGLVAVRLRALGAGPGCPVGLMGDRTVATAVAIVGTWRAGAAYLPLDPSHPELRLRGLLARAKAVAIVADLPSGTRAAALDLPTLLVTEDEDDDPHGLPELQPAWAAYCIATSGSTGEPKLVQVEHRNLAAYCDGLIAALALEQRHRFAMVTGWATDLGLTMFVAALTTGGALHLVPTGNLLQAAAFGGFVRAHQIEILKMTPGHLKALLAQPGGTAVLPSRLIMLGGEAIPWGLIETITHHAPQLAVWNHYGPTETTIGAITGPVELAERRMFETPPLGQPFANLTVTIRNDQGGETGTWLPGQIYIAGDTVASGYCGAPAATARVFSPAEGGACAYATGDRGRRLRDGRIVYLGRRDFQVKIAGYRVDPGEVEAALRSLSGVASAVVVARTNDSGEARLVAYAVPEPGAAFDPPGWRKALARILPPAALPTAFVEVAAIPLRDNGKPAFELLPPERPPTGSQSVSGEDLGAIEQVQAIWTELLGIAEVEPTERFFDIGGHSLQMVAMQQLLMDRLGIELTLLELFANPTVAGIAQLAAGRVGDDVAASAQGRARRQRTAMAELKRRREEVMNHDH